MSALTDSSPGFSIPGRYARGRILRIGPALNEVMEAHAYPAPLAELLAEALVLAGVFGSTLKEAGGLRGYIQHDADRLAAVPVDPSLFALSGQGYLAIMFDQAVTGERYQGLVPLEGGSPTEAAGHCLVQSEQIPGLLRIAV